MIVRALDSQGQWLFGKGLNDYASNQAEIALDIQMSLSMFLGDCFFATNVGIDWFNLLGGKNELAINLAVNAALLNVEGVVGILMTNISLNAQRNLTITYQVQTVYSTLSSQFVYDLGTTGVQGNITPTNG
jgi:hypothetical protein